MNILYILHERNLGGGTKSAITLIKELLGKGHKVRVILPIRFGQVYPELKKAGIPAKVIFFGWWMMPEYWKWWMKAAFRILYFLEGIVVVWISSYAKRHNIQVIHSNSSAIDVGARAAMRAHIPHVWHFREYGDSDYRLEYLKGREKSCKYVCSVPGKVIFISKDLRKHYAEDISDDVCEVIYNGLSETYLDQKNTDSHEPFTFLISGNLQRNKRQDLALDACGILQDRGYRNFKLIIAGARAALNDSKEFENELHAKAKRLSDNRVVFTGFVSDMKKMRKEADVELVCSTREAFGRVTIEAMMASNPVIASDSGASPELIEEGKNGWLFMAGDANSLADCMEKAINNQKIVFSMGQYAYLFAKEKFTSAQNTYNVETLYKGVIGNTNESK